MAKNIITTTRRAMLGFFLLGTLLQAVTASTTESSRRLLRNDNNNKNLKSYLRCHDEQHSCGDNNHRIQLCHYNGKEFTTLCVRSRSSIVEHLHPVDYCGPCISDHNDNAKKAFETTKELQEAVDWYLTMDPVAQRAAHKALAATYGYPMGQWNVGRIQNFRGLFARKVNFNEDLSHWNMSSATDLSFMFWHAHAFTGTGIGQWDTSNVQSLERTFFGAESFTADLSQWNTSSVTSLMGTFWRATSFDSDLSRWNTTAVTTMSRTFCDAILFNQDLSGWETQNVRDMSFMFLNAVQFHQPNLGEWNVQNVQTFERMFAKVPYYDNVTVQRNLLRQWKLSPTAVTTHMFTAPHDKSLRAQQLESNLHVSLDKLLRLAADQHHNNRTQTHDNNEEEPDMALSREILCHGGVCM